MKNVGHICPMLNKTGIFGHDLVTVRNIKMSGNKFSICTSLNADRHDKSKCRIFEIFILNAPKKNVKFSSVSIQLTTFR